jgi:cell division protein FtsB
MLKKFFIALAVALVVVLLLCWIYLPSVSRYLELRQEEEKLSKRIQEIDAQIKTLTDEKYLLQNDVAYLEKVIREELGLVKPGEIVYEMVTKKNAGEADKPAAAAANVPADSASKTAVEAPGSSKTETQSASKATTSSKKTRSIRSPTAKTTPPQKRPR